MSNKVKVLLILFITMLAITPSVNKPSGKGIKIVVSIASLGYIVQEITRGSSVSVDVILPEGADAHSYHLTPDDITRIESADLLVLASTANLSLEADMVTHMKAGAEYVDLQNYTKYGAALYRVLSIEHNFHGYWLYPDNALAIAKTINETLCALDPGEATIYSENLETFISRMDEFREELAAFSQKYGLNGTGVVAAVPGVAYILMMLGMDIKAMFLTGPNQFIGADEMMSIEDRIKSGEIKYIACPLSMKDAKAGQISLQISEDTGAPVLFVSIFSLSGAKGYFSFMNRVLGEMELSINMPVSKKMDVTIYFIAIGILGAAVVIESIVIYRFMRSAEEVE